jgi:hypothetical protein
VQLLKGQQFDRCSGLVYIYSILGLTMAGRNSSLYETSYIQYSPEQYTYSTKRTYNTALLIDHEVRLEKGLPREPLNPPARIIPYLLGPWASHRRARQGEILADGNR